MKKPQDVSKGDSEYRLRRRGLFAGAAALGTAALLKLTGAEKAQAANGGNVIIGATNLGTSTTYLVTDAPTGGSFGGYNTGGAAIGGSRAGTAVTGRSSRLNGIGVEGINDLGAAANHGAGVLGFSFDFDGTGVAGSASGYVDSMPSGATGVGVFGMATGSRTAVKGEATNGYAVWGASNGPAGVLGTTAVAYAVQGAASATGIGGIFSSVDGVGVRGISTNFVGMVGISAGSIGLYGSTSAAGQPAIYAENLAGGQAATFFGNVTVNGAFTVAGGPKAAAVRMPDGSYVTVYCQESPEAYFEDFGRGNLQNGVARVQLDPGFAAIVDLTGYHVFLCPEGDSGGLYVSQLDPRGFEVREQKGGKSSLPFSYRLVARRKDATGKRLERVDPKTMERAQRHLAKAVDLPSTAYGPSFTDRPAAAANNAPTQAGPGGIQIRPPGAPAN